MYYAPAFAPAIIREFVRRVNAHCFPAGWNERKPVSRATRDATRRFQEQCARNAQSASGYRYTRQQRRAAERARTKQGL